MTAKKYILGFLVIVLLTASLSACGSAANTAAEAGNNEVTISVQNTDEGANDVEDEDDVERPAGWSDETHGDSVDPNYKVVFDQDAVNRLDITISSENWQAMLDNMTELFGEQGDGSGGGFGERGDNRPGGVPDGDVPFERPENLQAGEQPIAPPDGMPDGEQPFQRSEGMAPEEGQNPGERVPGGGRVMGVGGMGGMESSENPDYVESTLEFDGGVWTHVGIRFRGNSTLRSSWNSGSLKISLKLDMDEFEDDYPEIDDQRFYGFKQLALVSNASDETLLREKLATGIFRDAGVAAPQTAFYAVYLDYGEGPEYLGLYTLIEIVEDTVIQTQFEEHDGNVYKPSGPGATFAAGSLNEASFEKQSNQDAEDWSDIETLFEALHAETRTSDPAAWRDSLEAVFNVDTFLNWLAANTVMQNWDTYGTMNHNYYLYHDPTSGQLTWIPWDNNEALSESGGMRNSVSLDMSDVGDQWPLIRYLLDDKVYHQQYVDQVETFIQVAFDPAELAAQIQEWSDLIAPYVIGENGEIAAGHSHLDSEEEFEQALSALNEHIESRYQAAEAFLASQ